MIDTVLIYPPKPFLAEPDAQAPLGLMYIASALEKDGYAPVIKSYSSYSVEDAISDLPPSLLYGITVTSMELPSANRFAKEIKKKYPSSNIVLGGPGVFDSLCLDVIDNEYIDAIFIGEGELSYKDVIEDAKNGSVRMSEGLVRIYHGKIVQDLDALPLPARHLMKDKLGGNVFAYGRNYVGDESTVIITSRGCPFVCAFCAAPSLREMYGGVRFRGVSSVIEEMKSVIDTYGIRQFRFSDDLFTSNKVRLIALCKEIAKLGIVYRASIRVKPLDEDMIQAMVDSGCVEVSAGIESFDNRVLLGLRKLTTCEDNVRALELLRAANLNTKMLFMIRTPFQEKDTCEINKYWIQRVPFTIISCTSYVPIPGSDVWNNPDNYNVEILTRDLEKYNFYFFGPSGRQALEPLIKIKNRDLKEFMDESEDFRTWVDEYGKLNTGAYAASK
jgi:anaerobic magnesium-protoporphyrin IX monomethyl ester cyclase